jgi:hypothetical protein
MTTQITGKSKNSEIQKEFKSELNSGYAFVAAIDETVNPEYLSVMFVQSADNGSKNPMNLALGWSSHIIKMWQNFKKELVNFEVGATADEIFSALAEDDIHINLKEVESFEPRTWTNKDGSKGVSQPKLNPSTNENVLIGGLPVYRSVEWTYDVNASITKVTEIDAIKFKADRSVGTPLQLVNAPTKEVEKDFALSQM